MAAFVKRTHRVHEIFFAQASAVRAISFKKFKWAQVHKFDGVGDGKQLVFEFKLKVSVYGLSGQNGLLKKDQVDKAGLLLVHGNLTQFSCHHLVNFQKLLDLVFEISLWYHIMTANVSFVLTLKHFFDALAGSLLLN